MSLTLRIKLLLGRFFGWDKDGIRVVLFVIVFIGGLLLVEWGYARVTADTSRGPECDDACIEEILNRHPVDIDRIINDSFNK